MKSTLTRNVCKHRPDDLASWAKEQGSGMSASTYALPIGGRAVAEIGRRSKSP